MATILGSGISTSVTIGLGYPSLVMGSGAITGGAPRSTANNSVLGIGIGRFYTDAPALAFGNMESLLEVIGESDTNIGGYHITRLIDNVVVGQNVFPVENILNWATSGKIFVDGTIYNYTSAYGQTISGVSYVHNGEIVVGAKYEHLKTIGVVELDNPRCAINRAKKAMLVDYAVDDNLSIVGRNLGVYRSPYLNNDEVYRGVIKALAYNPKGTFYGIDLALEAILGKGMYHIWTDPIRYPCVVFISISNDFYKTDTSIGHSYLEDVESPVAVIHSGKYDLIPLSKYPVARGCGSSVVWHDMDFLSSFVGQLPTADKIVDYTGDTGTHLWEFDGGTEADYITSGADYITFDTNNGGVYTTSGYHVHTRFSQRWQENSWVVNMVFKIPSGSCTWANPIQFGMQVYEGVLGSCFGWGLGKPSSDLLLYLIVNEASSGSGLATITYDTWYEVQMVKRKQTITISVNGCVVLERGVGSIGGSFSLTASQIRFGCFGLNSGTSTAKAYIKQVGVKTHASQDFYSYLELLGAIPGVGSPNNIEFSVPGTALSSDSGKYVRVFDSFPTTPLPSGGNNNGVWKVASYVDDHTLTLVGDTKTGVFVDSGSPQIIEVPTDLNMFTFPDDLGREIVLSGSSSTNDGTFVINALYQIGTTTDLSTFTTKITEKTNVCKVTMGTHPAFVTEAGLEAHLNPTFTAEACVTFYLSSAGLVENISSAPYNHLRIEVPLSTYNAPVNKAVDAMFSNVLTSEVLLDNSVNSEEIIAMPGNYEYYPFYLNDTLGLVNDYISGLTVAGVVAQTSIED